MAFFGRVITVTTTATSLYNLMIAAGITSPPFTASEIRLHPDTPFSNPIYLGDSMVSASSHAHHFDSGGKTQPYEFTAGEAAMKLSEIYLVSTGGTQTISLMVL